MQQPMDNQQMQSRMGMPQTGYGHNSHHHNGMQMMNPLHMGMRPQMQRTDSKKPGQRKPNVPGEKKSNAPKSPAVKRVKEVVYVKLFVVQQQFKQTEKPMMDEIDVNDDDIPPVEAMEEEEEKPDEEPKQDEEAEQKPDEQQIPQDEEEDQQPDERPDIEEHLSYEQSQKDEEEESVELYDSNESRSI